MTTIATCEQGSSSTRTTVFRTSGVGFEELSSKRVKTRLGETVFVDAHIPRDKRHEILDAFRSFQEDSWLPNGVEYVHAAATSAARDAKKGDWLRLQRGILREVGVFVPTITSEHEALLAHKAVAHELALKGDTSLDKGTTCIIDIGGGSIQATTTKPSRGVKPDSINLGTLRLLQVEAEHPMNREKLLALIRQELTPLVRRIQREGGPTAELQIIATGGNSRELSAQISKWKAIENPNRLSRDDLRLVSTILPEVPLASRSDQLGVTKSRRDMIVPAALILGELLDMLKVTELKVSQVGVRYGLMLEALELLPKRGTLLNKATVVEHANSLLGRLGLDQRIANKRADIALQLFDDPELTRMHKLGPEARVLLEAAALLQDVGTIFEDRDDYHKDTLRILSSIIFAGLDRRQQMIVANVARYHRGALPDDSKHESYKALSEEDRKSVVRMCAILRLANALQGKAADDSVIVLAFDREDDNLLLRPGGLVRGFRHAVRDASRSFKFAFKRSLVAERAA